MQSSVALLVIQTSTGSLASVYRIGLTDIRGYPYPYERIYPIRIRMYGYIRIRIKKYTKQTKFYKTINS